MTERDYYKNFDLKIIVFNEETNMIRSEAIL